MVRITLLCPAYKKSFIKENSEEITLYRKIHGKKNMKDFYFCASTENVLHGYEKSS